MRFNDWIKTCETVEDFDPSVTQPYHNKSQVHYQPSQASATPLPTNNGTWNRLIQWYNNFYQNYGGWAAVENQALKDPSTKQLVNNIKQQAVNFKPQVNPDEIDDENDVTDRWIDSVTRKIVDHMINNGHGYWEKQVSKMSKDDNTPIPSANTNMSANLQSRIDNLEKRLSHMTQLLQQIHPAMFNRAVN